jgi:hypothetical protein
MWNVSPLNVVLSLRTHNNRKQKYRDIVEIVRADLMVLARFLRRKESLVFVQITVILIGSAILLSCGERCGKYRHEKHEL